MATKGKGKARCSVHECKRKDLSLAIAKTMAPFLAASYALKHLPA
jgi:hypothetical protein